ncbi:hypothetical protein FJT64_014721 [Amphibalanus amphitrite]|uniref:Protein sleepless n=1 Tax=Amphibalanus amphitrite TaxID=1232801 RepID=A0A6A4UZJ4_AMPAM|nr:hypothetical protein FJT64_014721 [Amphibalanus amphitrite]
MSRRPLVPLLALAALLALPSACQALKCYLCVSPISTMSKLTGISDKFTMLSLLKESASTVPSCAAFDETQDKFKMTCSKGYNGCIKLDVNGTTAARYCVKESVSGCLKHTSGVEGCACTTDYCNSAGLSTPALLLLLPAALLAAIHTRQ